jgi:hypothetical protein
MKHDFDLAKSPSLEKINSLVKEKDANENELKKLYDETRKKDTKRERYPDNYIDDMENEFSKPPTLWHCNKPYIFFF